MGRWEGKKDTNDVGEKLRHVVTGGALVLLLQ